MNLDQELWKDIPNWTGYQASSFGRIRSYDRIVISKNNVPKSIKGRILKQSINNSQKYYSVILWKNRKSKCLSVHKLVSNTFLIKGINQCVNHKDGNKLNNNLNNLEWTTFSLNQKHSYDILGRKAPRGNQSGRARKVYQYDLWGDLVDSYETLSIAANKLNIGVSLITQCCQNNQIRLAKDFIWSYTPITQQRIQEIQNYYITYINKTKERLSKTQRVNTTKVVNTVTGDIFNSIKDAAIEVNIPIKKLQGMIYGNTKNTTPIIYLSDYLPYQSSIHN